MVDDYSYYFEDSFTDEYEWKPYLPTDPDVNDHVDVLTAPNSSDAIRNDTRQIEGEPTIVPYPFLEEYADLNIGPVLVEEKNLASCPQANCRCVCDPL